MSYIELKNGAVRYDTVAEMSEDAQKNAESLNTFNKNYWTVTNGVLSWINA